MPKATTKTKPAAKKKTAAKRRPTPPVSDAEAAAMPALKRRRIHFHRSHFNFLLIIGALLIIGTGGYDRISAANQAEAQRETDAVGLTNQADETHLFYVKRLKPLIDGTKKFEAAQTSAGLEVANPTTIETEISQIETDLRQSKFHQASSSTNSLSTNLTTWQKSLNDQLSAAKLRQASTPKLSTISATLNRQYQVPILIYHKPPTDFEQQLQVLRQRNYTTITFAQLTAAFNGASLPPKPVIITFDDGFADQMSAFALLEEYKMKATFFIIDGGAGSNWCIGANRRYNDPSQPPGGCGDAYLSWDQVRQLDASGLITIGSHTIDHPDLASETAEQQSAEIIGGKTELEQEIGHKVYDFAYPYGDYNSTTISIVQQAGFTDAVTTAPGTLQSAANRYTMPRIRATYDLP